MVPLPSVPAFPCPAFPCQTAALTVPESPRFRTRNRDRKARLIDPGPQRGSAAETPLGIENESAPPDGKAAPQIGAAPAMGSAAKRKTHPAQQRARVPSPLGLTHPRTRPPTRPETQAAGILLNGGFLLRIAHVVLDSDHATTAILLLLFGNRPKCPLRDHLHCPSDRQRTP
jgi:hypothetical protein